MVSPLQGEPRNLAGHFTFADVGSIRAMGFFYIVIGVFWFGGALFAR